MRLPPFALALPLLLVGGCTTTPAAHLTAVVEASGACDAGSRSACITLQALHVRELQRQQQVQDAWTNAARAYSLGSR